MSNAAEELNENQYFLYSILANVAISKWQNGELEDVNQLFEKLTYIAEFIKKTDNLILTQST